LAGLDLGMVRVEPLHRPTGASTNLGHPPTERTRNLTGVIDFNSDYNRLQLWQSMLRDIL